MPGLIHLIRVSEVDYLPNGGVIYRAEVDYEDVYFESDERGLSVKKLVSMALSALDEQNADGGFDYSLGVPTETSPALYERILGMNAELGYQS